MSSILIKTLWRSKNINSYRTNSNILSRLSSTYKAAVFKNGSLEINELKKVKKIAKDEVRIKVEYCSVNYIDYLSLKNEKPPITPGVEFSGEVVEIGSDVKPNIATVGERVVALNLQNSLGLAEECVVNKHDVWRLPPNVSNKEGAILTYCHSTALLGFTRHCPITPPDCGTILISCGSGGLGLAALDLAAGVYKAKVIGVCNTEDNASLVREKGAFSALKYDPKKLKKTIMEATKNEGAAVIFDTVVGSEILEVLASCSSKDGKILYGAPLIGNTIPTPPPNTSLTVVSLQALRDQNLDLYRQTVEETLELADQELISAHVSVKYELGKVKEAFKYIEKEKSTGKVLIEIYDD